MEVHINVLSMETGMLTTFTNFICIDYLDCIQYTSIQGFDDLHLSLLVMKKTLAVMQVLTLCQCGGSFQCLPRYVADGHRKRYHTALHSLELAVDKIAIITTAINEPGISVDVVS